MAINHNRRELMLLIKTTTLMYISNVKITNCVYLLIVYNTVRGIKFAPIHVLNDTVNVKKNYYLFDRSNQRDLRIYEPLKRTMNFYRNLFCTLPKNILPTLLRR